MYCGGEPSRFVFMQTNRAVEEVNQETLAWQLYELARQDGQVDARELGTIRNAMYMEDGYVEGQEADFSLGNLLLYTRLTRVANRAMQHGCLESNDDTYTITSHAPGGDLVYQRPCPLTSAALCYLANEFDAVQEQVDALRSNPRYTYNWLDTPFFELPE